MKSLKRIKDISQSSFISNANALGLKKYSQAKRFLYRNSKLDDEKLGYIAQEYKLIQEKKSELSRLDRDRVIMLYKRNAMAEQKKEAPGKI
jgi:hypothetical protein